MDKGIVISVVVASFQEKGAQFLKFDKKTERWYYDIGDKQAQAKLGHASDTLRFGKYFDCRKEARGTKKEMETEQ
jgi:hypothetical protein